MDEKTMVNDVLDGVKSKSYNISRSHFRSRKYAIKTNYTTNTQ